MAFYAIFSDAGLPLGFWMDTIHGARTRPIYGDLPEPTEDEPFPVRPVIGEEPNPDCLIPAEAVEITDEQWLDMVQHPGLRRWQDGEVVEHVPEPPAPTVETYRTAIQRHVDQVAQSRGYDSGVSLASYVASTNETWASEAQIFVAWRDAVWTYAYAELAKVETQERAVPSVEEFIEELPEIEWRGDDA